jgi:hypothetical protein
MRQAGGGSWPSAPLLPARPAGADAPLAGSRGTARTDAGGGDAAAGGVRRQLVAAPALAAGPLPGDGSEAVAAFAEYLAGTAPPPPRALLPFTRPPTAGGVCINLRALFLAAVARGGCRAAAAAGEWPAVVAQGGPARRRGRGGGGAARVRVAPAALRAHVRPRGLAAADGQPGEPAEGSGGWPRCCHV